MTAMRIASPYSRKMLFLARTALSDELFSFNVIGYLSSNRSNMPDARYRWLGVFLFGIGLRVSGICHLLHRGEQLLGFTQGKLSFLYPRSTRPGR
jgi:hypothetical protein